MSQNSLKYYSINKKGLFSLFSPFVLCGCSGDIDSDEFLFSNRAGGRS